MLRKFDRLKPVLLPTHAGCASRSRRHLCGDPKPLNFTVLSSFWYVTKISSDHGEEAMRLVTSAGRAPAKTALVGLLFAVVAFFVLGIIGQSIPSMFALTGPAAAYRVLYVLFLLALMVAVTTFGLWCSNRIGRCRAPQVATSGVWIAIASFFIAVMVLGVDASWTDGVWSAGLLGMIAGFIVGISGFVASVWKLDAR